MGLHFFSINLLFRSEVLKRKDFPLGDESWTGTLLKVSRELENPEGHALAPALRVL